MSNRTLSIILFVIGGFGTAFLVLGIPSLIQRRNTRIKGTDIARTRAGDSWGSMSREEQKKLIRESISRLNEPSNQTRNDEDPHYLD